MRGGGADGTGTGGEEEAVERVSKVSFRESGTGNVRCVAPSISEWAWNCAKNGEGRKLLPVSNCDPAGGNWCRNLPAPGGNKQRKRWREDMHCWISKNCKNMVTVEQDDPTSLLREELDSMTIWPSQGEPIGNKDRFTVWRCVSRKSPRASRPLHFNTTNTPGGGDQKPGSCTIRRA
ncbi:hypothetical protein NQZ68_026175 [Dissostichus eleginoides]|nr:hypothetical protein NQZ68_026175 [Dissostichus eleginoides]